MKTWASDDNGTDSTPMKIISSKTRKKTVLKKLNPISDIVNAKMLLVFDAKLYKIAFCTMQSKDKTNPTFLLFDWEKSF